MQQIQLQLSTLPVILLCFQDASIAFAPSQQFKTIIDDSGACWDMEGFSIGDKSYDYQKRYYYKDNEVLLKYLQSLNMELPTFNNFGFNF